MPHRSAGLPPPLFSRAIPVRLLLEPLLPISLAGLGGFLVATRPETTAWIYLLSPGGALVLLAAFVLGLVVWRRPWLGPVLLTALVFSNLSQALVRQQGIPSVLQPFILVLAFAAGRFPSSRWRQAASLPLTTTLAAVTLWLFASTMWSRNPELADLRSLESLKSFLIFFLIAGMAASATLVVRSAWALVGTAALLAALGIFQSLSGRYDLEFFGLARIKNAHIYGDVFEPRIAGPIGDPNFFAQILLFALPLAVALAWSERRSLRRLLGLLCALSIVTAVIFTYSRGAGIALAGQTVVAVLFHRWRGRLLLVGSVLAVFLIVLLPSEFSRRLTTVRQLLPGSAEVLDPDSSFEERRLFTLSAWEMFLDQPLVGVGAGNYTAHFDEYAGLVGTPLRAYDDPDRPHFPHNLYLEIGAETGVIGLLLFLAVLGAASRGVASAQRAFLRHDRRQLAALAMAGQIAVIGYLVSSLFLHGHFQRYLWLLFGLCGALMLLADEVTDRPAAEADSNRATVAVGGAE